MRIDRTHHRARPLVATAVAMALALAACGSDETGETSVGEDAAKQTADSDSAETSTGDETDERSDGIDEPSDDAAVGDDLDGEVQGTVTLDGATTEVNATFWCEPRESRDLGGSEVTLDVYAMDDQETMWLHAYELVRDRDGEVLQRVRVNTNVDGDMGTYQSGDLDDRSDDWPALTVEGDRVTVSAVVQRGGELVPVEADFTLPAAEGSPGMC